MYHPGKVLAVIKFRSKDTISSDTSSQAVLEMWDGNQLTFDIEKKIAPKVKGGDIVLVDYTQQVKGPLPLPRHLVIKILRGSTAKDVWEAYKSYQRKKGGRSRQRPTAEPAQKSISPKPLDTPPRYFG